uniref:HTH psq-type domain-containing protein n=1 Tax=Periophthalmus magnuspinnatus TaxID=409849 RepID=A0A3B3ZYT4_9GOBI
SKSREEHGVGQRQRVVDLWKDGKSEGAIGLELRMPKSTVHSIIVKYRLSNTVENLPRKSASVYEHFKGPTLHKIDSCEL